MSPMICSPLDQFEVTTLLSLSAPLLNLGLYLTNLGLYTVISATIILGVFINANVHLVPSQWSVATESLYASLQGLVSDQIGDAQTQYIPLALSIFSFILVSNLSGNIPYSFSIYTSAVVTMFMSIAIFISVTFLGLYIHKTRWFSFFVPGGTPLALVPLLVLIETISYLARSVSLGVRLFANLVAGKVLAFILAGGLYSFFSKGIFIAILALIPLIIFLAVLGLELAVALIQAYVFTILTCSYVADAIKLH
jgi:F-type H+-transporting ATPase subunit a